MPVASYAPTARWDVQPRDAAAEAVLQRELGLSKVVAALLAQRGLGDPAAADRFLRSSLDDLHDPKLLPDFDPACAAILTAKDRGDLIYVHGDYDVDGVTSAAIFDRFLNKIGCKVKTHVPHRMREGYGIHESAVDEAIAAGAKLFLTCDCGSGAVKQIAKAKEAGMTVVVTDHHLFGEHPDVTAFINPHRQDSLYPFADLCGAGVVFKLCAGITQEMNWPLDKFYKAFLDLAVLGTVADVMPLTGENRIIAKHGLVHLKETKKIGLQSLMKKAEMKMDKPFGSYEIGFVLGPRLNAAGRVDDAAKSLQLLIEQDPTAADVLADFIEQSNQTRRDEQRRIGDEAVLQCEDEGVLNDWVLVVCREGWHTGVVGIVANRLVETFYKPSFVMSINPETGIAGGSARSIPGFHLANAIAAHPDLFLSGGGHAMAAGCTFEFERLAEVRAALHAEAVRTLTDEDLVPRQRVDLEVEPGDLSLQVCEEISRLEPFGVANPTPVMVARNTTLVEMRPTKNPIHMNLTLRQGSAPAVKAIAFQIGEALSEYESGVTMDLLFKPSINEWKGQCSMQWQVQDYRLPE